MYQDLDLGKIENITNYLVSVNGIPKYNPAVLAVCCSSPMPGRAQLGSVMTLTPVQRRKGALERSTFGAN